MNLSLAAFGAFFSPVLPNAGFYAPWVILAFLGFAALVDALTGRVPWIPLLAGASVTLFVAARHETSSLLVLRLAMALISFAVLRFANAAYVWIAHRDAFGMGDVKWTAVAAAAFGLPGVFWAWIFGAWIGLVWLGVRFVIGLLYAEAKPSGYVHFAPFLMIGLLAKLYGWTFLTKFMPF